ncbi:hypothetical protein M8J77_022663 [Diaphorina citri]|nr:hypothetical protein M8J77_022663 [Diaphorina citri]
MQSMDSDEDFSYLITAPFVKEDEERSLSSPSTSTMAPIRSLKRKNFDPERINRHFHYYWVERREDRPNIENAVPDASWLEKSNRLLLETEKPLVGIYGLLGCQYPVMSVDEPHPNKTNTTFNYYGSLRKQKFSSNTPLPEIKISPYSINRLERIKSIHFQYHRNMMMEYIRKRYYFFRLFLEYAYPIEVADNCLTRCS